ncbi:hypothetical protein EON65_10705 [archaeon]|nr:MAG: hypothetical protein EON65_10705 [archaeon]
MGLFDLLDEKEQMFANGTPEPTPHTPAVSPSSSVVDVVNDDGNSEPVKGASIVAEDDDWISTDAKKTPSRMTVELYDTKVHNKILPENLIWAPHYRYKDRLFPARLCANNELQFESWVKTWPLPPDEAVVEIFCQEKSSASSPLIIVKQKKLLPFWKRNSTDVKSNYEGTLEWNETRLGNLHLVCESHVLLLSFRYCRCSSW